MLRKEAAGGQCPLRPRSLRKGLGPEAPRGEDSRPGRQERQETGCSGRGARKLSVLLHHLWITGELYEPLHNTQRSEVRAA
jgi:hypothetical protein